MKRIENGSVLSPGGFRAGFARCGIKGAEGEPDVALIAGDAPAAAAGVFTTNRFAAAPVQWCRSVLPCDELRAVVVNSGNANACTGEQGDKDARATAELAASLLDCNAEQVAVCSTGIIGHPLPMDRLAEGVRAAHAALADGPDAARGAERAIMTTDTRPKASAVSGEIEATTFTVGGMAKGSGMISPHMATMLAFVTTDVAAPAAVLGEMLARCADLTFNRITVDGDSSTNDTVLLLAGGASGVTLDDDGPAADAFEEALLCVMEDLARQIVRDGEGATRLIEITVTGARDEAHAERAARAVANSPLVKCAVHGGDPNWGRIVCAAGYSGAELTPQRTRLDLGSTRVFEAGLPTGADAADQMAGDEVHILLDLGVGDAEATVWTCDLSQRYVEINAQYHT